MQAGVAGVVGRFGLAVSPALRFGHRRRDHALVNTMSGEGIDEPR